MAYYWKTEAPGIVSHHADSCPVRDGGACTCDTLGYRAGIPEPEPKRHPTSPTYRTVEEALAWQRDQVVSKEAPRFPIPDLDPDPDPEELRASRRDQRPPPSADRLELRNVIDEFLQAVEDGLAGGRNGQANVRALRSALGYVDSELGTMDIGDVRRRHIKALLDELRASGLAAAQIHSIVDALHALYGYAVQRELVDFSPVIELELPESQNGVPHADPRPEPSTAGWTPPEGWTPPRQVGDPWTPPPYSPPRFSQPPFAAPQPTQPYSDAGYTSAGFPPPNPYTPPDWPGYTSSGPLSAMLGTPPTSMTSAQAQYDATMQERWLWWTVRIVVIVFVLIALVLAAESV